MGLGRGVGGRWEEGAPDPGQARQTHNPSISSSSSWKALAASSCSRWALEAACCSVEGPALSLATPRPALPRQEGAGRPHKGRGETRRRLPVSGRPPREAAGAPHQAHWAAAGLRGGVWPSQEGLWGWGVAGSVPGKGKASPTRAGTGLRPVGGRWTRGHSCASAPTVPPLQASPPRRPGGGREATTQLRLLSSYCIPGLNSALSSRARGVSSATPWVPPGDPAVSQQTRLALCPSHT